MASVQTIPKSQQHQQPKPKHKKFRFMVLVSGVFLVSIVTRYSQIYSVYHSNDKLLLGRSLPKSNLKSRNNRANLGIAPDIEIYSKYAPEIESKIGSKIQGTTSDEILIEEEPKQAANATTKRIRGERRRNGNKNAGAGDETLPVPKKKKRKGDPAYFRREHWKIKQEFLERMQNVTGASREAVDARADQFFVDLAKDPPPKGSDSDSWFVMHIGPPKTATTTVQCGLEKHSLRLAKTDGYHYVGGGCGVDKKEYLMPNGESTVLRMPIVWGFQGFVAGQKALEDFVSRAKEIRQRGRSVVLSSELFGSKMLPFPEVMNNLRDTLTTSAGFDPEKIRIVLSYRHFVDWLPSFHYQRFGLNKVDKPWILRDPLDVRVPPFLQYADQYLSSWEKFQKKAGNEIRDRVRKLEEQAESDPDSNDEDSEDLESSDKDLGLPFPLPFDRQSIHPSWWLYKLWSHYFPLKNQVQVYDMHSTMNSNRPRDDTVTNFICNMLPTADETCSRLIHLEDQKEQKRLIDKHKENGTDTTSINNSDDWNLKEQDEGGAFGFEDTELYSRASFLYHGRKSLKHGGNVTGEITIRTSSDHYAAIFVETMLIRGDIMPFDDAPFNEAFFASYEGNFEDARLMIDGQVKGDFINTAQQLLHEHDVRPPNQKYFDCMPKDLEERFLNASLTFLDLIYKNTEMLSLAAEASSATPGSASEAIKEQRFAQARADHTRIFEQNKAKGKYCDINLDKIKKEIPAVFEELASRSYKPRFNKFKYRELPDYMRPHVDALDMSNRRWDTAGKSLSHRKLVQLWELASPKQKAAIFALFV